MKARRTDLSKAGNLAAPQGLFGKVFEMLRILPGRPDGGSRNGVETRPGAPAADRNTSDDTAQHQLAASREKERALEHRLNTRHAELAAVTRLLHTSELAQTQFQDRAEWLTAVTMVLIDQPVWWRILPPPVQRRAVHRRLRRRKLFDAQSYLARYPDVASSRTDPLRHYVRHGIQENRAMGFTPPPGGWITSRTKQLS
jgi:hypothetical protein